MKKFNLGIGIILIVFAAIMWNSPDHQFWVGWDLALGLWNIDRWATPPEPERSHS